MGFFSRSAFGGRRPSARESDEVHLGFGRRTVRVDSVKERTKDRLSGRRETKARQKGRIKNLADDPRMIAKQEREEKAERERQAEAERKRKERAQADARIAQQQAKASAKARDMRKAERIRDPKHRAAAIARVNRRYR